MNAQKVIESRRSSLFAEIRAAEAKFRDALKAVRRARGHLESLRARSMELYELDKALGRMDQSPEEDHRFFEIESGEKVSHLLRMVLLKSEAGLTLAQLGEVLEPHTKRATISATLYNMKKRGEVEHNEATGLYRLSGRVPLRQSNPR